MYLNFTPHKIVCCSDYSVVAINMKGAAVDNIIISQYRAILKYQFVKSYNLKLNSRKICDCLTLWHFYFTVIVTLQPSE